MEKKELKKGGSYFFRCIPDDVGPVGGFLRTGTAFKCLGLEKLAVRVSSLFIRRIRINVILKAIVENARPGD